MSTPEQRYVARNKSTPEKKEKFLKMRRETLKRYRQKNRDIILRHVIKSGGCIDCSFNDIRALELDHIKGEKKGSTMAMVSMGEKTLIEELNKCVVRCTNCHRKRTVSESNSFKHRFMMEKGLLDAYI